MHDVLHQNLNFLMELTEETKDQNRRAVKWCPTNTSLVLLIRVELRLNQNDGRSPGGRFPEEKNILTFHNSK